MAFVNRRPSLSDLKQRGFRGELPTLAGNPTYKDIGKAAMVCTAIEQAYANDVSGASADPTTLGKAHAWTSSITNRVNALAADADAPATIQGVLNQIHEKLTVMQADTAKIQVIQADMVKIQADIVKIQADIVKIQADTAKIPEINTRFETAEKTIKDLTKTLGLLLTPVSKARITPTVDWSACPDLAWP
ncbi:hypothetical protein FRB90_002603 [Tulasnella sp. 427]|nr:hypothetical protein FRB90_002603 [Tulasnella sp. 427]